MRFHAPPIALAVLLLPSPPAMAAPPTHVVVIDKMKFGVMPARVRAGDRITWVNRDLFRHTATAKDGSFHVDLQPGAKATVTVRRPGAIPVVCRYHPGMKAMLKVVR
jgi:plastocyanin